MEHTFNFHSDPGHGWLEVPLTLLQDLGIMEKISKYSYRNSTSGFLEEDCDIGHFFDAYQAKYGVEPCIKEVPPENRDSPIRNMKRF